MGWYSPARMLDYQQRIFVARREPDLLIYCDKGADVELGQVDKPSMVGGGTVLSPSRVRDQRR